MTLVATGFRLALWLVATGLGVLLLSSLRHQPLTVLQGAALALFAATSMVRPLAAVLVLAALGPLLGVIGALFAWPFGGARLFETLVLLLILGWTAGRVRYIRSAHWRSVDWVLFGFGALAASSAAAHLPVTALRHGTDSASAALWEFLTGAYLAHPPDFEIVREAVLLLEGVGLCALVSRVGADAIDASRISAMTIVGAAGAASINAYRLLEVALRRGPLTDTLGPAFSSLRINTQFGDLNAAGSYFAMAFVAAVGLSDFSAPRGRMCALAAVPLGVAVWLSGSRAALAAVALGVVALLLMRFRQRAHAAMPARQRHLLIATLAIASIAVFILYPPGRNVTMRYSVWARAELTATGLRMLGDRPVFGVGVSRFYDLFPHYASPELRQAFFESALVPVTRENAHNNLMQILAELGLAGFVMFIVVLWLALRPDQLERGSRGIRLALIVAIAVFLFTALFGHPLLTYEVAYPFWIFLGVAAASAPEVVGRRAAAIRTVCASLAVCLIAAMPARAAHELRTADLHGVVIGMSNWQRDESGKQYCLAAARSSLFIDSSIRVVSLPLRAPASTACTVEISIEGRPADRVTVPSTFWQDVRLRLPAAGNERRSFRIDLSAQGECVAGQPAGSPRLMVGRPDALGAASGPAAR